jgi:hypothetical protein
MFGAAHRGHEFERLSSVYDSHVTDLRTDIQHLQSRAQALRDVEAKLQLQIDQVHNAKNRFLINSIFQFGSFYFELTVDFD